MLLSGHVYITTSDIRTCTYVRVRVGGQEIIVFRKIWHALFFCYLRFEIRPFALLWLMKRSLQLLSYSCSYYFWFQSKCSALCWRFRRSHLEMFHTSNFNKYRLRRKYFTVNFAQFSEHNFPRLPVSRCFWKFVSMFCSAAFTQAY